LPWKGIVRHLKDGQARVEEIPLRLSVPELAEQARGARAEVEVFEIDFLSLEASVRYLGVIESAVTDITFDSVSDDASDESSAPTNKPEANSGATE
jgi:exoribonuclease-2